MSTPDGVNGSTKKRFVVCEVTLPAPASVRVSLQTMCVDWPPTRVWSVWKSSTCAERTGTDGVGLVRPGCGCTPDCGSPGRETGP